MSAFGFFGIQPGESVYPTTKTSYQSKSESIAYASKTARAGKRTFYCIKVNKNLTQCSAKEFQKSKSKQFACYPNGKVEEY